MSSILRNTELAVAIVRDAGGEIVGGHRMQAAAYLLEAAGLGDGFHFHYTNTCPYCEPLDDLAHRALLRKELSVEKCVADWGGTYWIYRVDGLPGDDVPPARVELATLAAKSDAIALAVASSAIFVKLNDTYDDTWAEMLNRRPHMLEGERMENAKGLLRKLARLPVPVPLPDLLGERDAGSDVQVLNESGENTLALAS